MARYKNKKFLDNLWIEEFMVNSHCGLCGNSGRIDTTGMQVKTFASIKLGTLKAFCICPNGRALKAAQEKQ